MLSQEAWDEVSDLIHPEDFYSPAHQKIYHVISTLYQKGQPADLITVPNALLEKGELEFVGGPNYLAELVEATPTAANIVSYAKIIREKSSLRRIIHTSQSLIDGAFSQQFENFESFLDQCESRIFALTKQTDAKNLVPFSESIKRNLDYLEEREDATDIPGIPSDFIDLDNLTAGFQKGELTILAARPSMGKTAFSLNITQAALRAQKKVAFFSLEMDERALSARFLANEASVPLSNMRVGKIKDKDWPRLIGAAAKLSEYSLFINDSSLLSPLDIRSQARRMKSTVGLDMIVVDYLQLMTLKTKTESREREVSEISRLLKAIAKELEIPIIALAQINRSVESRSNRRPILSDLRESGSIEQDADLIMMLYREDYYEKENAEAHGVAEVIIGKQRNGPTGTVKLKWEPEFGRFSNYVEEYLGPPPPTPSHPPHFDSYESYQEEEPSEPPSLELIQNFAPTVKPNSTIDE